MIFFIALSLSMDALSLALAYGTTKINKKFKLLISTIVGLFHLFMPIIGNIIGTNILSIIKVNPNTLVSIILIFIGVNMCFKKEEKINIIENIVQIFLFALAVSIDSFSVGLGLNAITKYLYIAPFIFSVTAAIITYIGLNLGNAISNKLGALAPIIGGIALIIIGITYIV